MKTCICILYFILSFISLSSQSKINCFNKHQLLKMESAPIDEVKGFLTANDWLFDQAEKDKLFMDFGCQLVLNKLRWQKLYQGTSVELYSKNSTRIVKYDATHTCYTELLHELKSGNTTIKQDTLTTLYSEGDLSIEVKEFRDESGYNKQIMYVYNHNNLKKDILECRRKEYLARKMMFEQNFRYERLLNEGDSLFQKSEFRQAKLKYSEACEIGDYSECTKKIYLCDYKIDELSVKHGDSLLVLENYFEAINVFKHVLSRTKDLKLSKHAANSITVASDKLKKQRVERLVDSANLFYHKKDYNGALSYFKKVIETEPLHPYALQKISYLNNILPILNSRTKRIFSLFELDSLYYKKIYDSLEIKINSIILKYNAEYSTALNIKLVFDTVGRNKSFVIDGNLNNELSIIKKYLLTIKPPNIEGFFFNTIDTLKIKIVKEKTKLLYSANGSHNIQSKQIYNYLYNKKLPYGKYSIIKSYIMINKELYKTNYLINYSARGSSNALYSLILPGLGSKRVSYGQVKSNRFKYFLLTSAIGAISRFYSERQYSSYKIATNQNHIDRYYNNANYSNKLSLVCFGLSACIVGSDFIWTFKRGYQNKKITRQLKNNLKLHPIIIN